MKKLLIYLLLINSTYLSSNNTLFEINQMLGLNIGRQIDIDELVGVRFTAGISPFSIKTVSYNFLFYIYLDEGVDNFSYSLEAGLLLGYFDLFENKIVDWDKYINSPYAGWLPGVAIRGEFSDNFSLRIGLSYWIEWQEDSGCKYGIIPIVTAGWIF